MTAKSRAVLAIGVVAVAVAAVASVMLYRYLKSQEEMVMGAVATEKVLVASTNVPLGTTLQSSHMKAIDWPRSSLPTEGVTTMDDAIGRVTLQSLRVNDPITEAKLLPKEGAPGVLSYRVPEGHRAMTVGVDQVAGVAGFVSPGNMVDVIVTAHPSGYRDPMSKIVLQNVPVLATGQIMLEEKEDGGPTIVPTVTLDVSPEEAETLALASNQGNIQLLLRKAGDGGTVLTKGATVRQLVTSTPPKPRVAAIKVKKPTYRPTHRTRKISIEVIRNDEKSIETFNVREPIK